MNVGTKWTLWRSGSPHSAPFLPFAFYDENINSISFITLLSYCCYDYYYYYMYRAASSSPMISMMGESIPSATSALFASFYLLYHHPLCAHIRWCHTKQHKFTAEKRKFVPFCSIQNILIRKKLSPVFRTRHDDGIEREREEAWERECVTECGSVRRKTIF